MILVLDFGSQYTQLIAKTYRRLGFACDVIAGNLTHETWKKNLDDGAHGKVSGVIFSGSPSSVGLGLEPHSSWFDLGVPVLGICFGYQYLAEKFGGKVSSSAHREYGAAKIQLTADAAGDALTEGLASESVVWMSHGDSVVAVPPGAKIIIESRGKIAGFSIPGKKIWGLQFHPEVFHSQEGEKLLHNFAARILALTPDWSIRDELGRLRQKLKEELKGVDVVYAGASGGVDSTVLVALLSEFVKVKALFVDHGFQRAYDIIDLKAVFNEFPNVDLEIIDAKRMFWAELDGVSDPELKRKTMGRLFIDAFYSSIPHAKTSKVYLAQGTIYSDVIESAQNHLAAAHKIKSHHNVGGLPPDLNAILVEPLRHFFKDEVREIGRTLGIREAFLERHPFPGPGLAIRCVGELRPEKIEILRQVDAIFYEELVARGLYRKTWQALAALLPVQSVGVMGDGRTYEWAVALRAVSSIDAMTAEATEFEWKDLKEITSRIVNEVRGVNRVVYDMTSKPPGTIEWE
ncbi:MAG TPA: glutamine-hydrolyzing GMP synthase [Bdellovibrionota bacterium]|nr:glutamine-hydrolyzing GMP synthase [Bdellovibrionota bacterium]